MTNPDRGTVRTQLASILSTALVGAGKLCQALYAFQPATFNGQSPVVTLSSGGAFHQNWTHQGARTTFSFYIHTFVLYSDPDTGWDEEDAEDRLDDIEQKIIEILIANRVTTYWAIIHQDEPSTAMSVIVGGDEYRLELITIILEIYS